MKILLPLNSIVEPNEILTNNSNVRVFLDLFHIIEGLPLLLYVDLSLTYYEIDFEYYRPY